MWIQFNNAFLSIVENRNNKLELLVRARVKGDIEKIFPDADVFEDDSSALVQLVRDVVLELLVSDEEILM